MPALAVPLTVKTASEDIDVMVRAAGPVSWERAEKEIVAAAGLDETTRLYLGVGHPEPTWLVGSPPLVAGATLTTTPADALPDMPAVIVAVAAGPDAGRWAELGSDPITVGRSPSATLSLTDPQVSSEHAVLRPTTSGLMVSDCDSTNGVFVDGQPALEPLPAHTGSIIRIGGSILAVHLTTEPPGTFRPDGYGYLVRDGAPAAIPPSPLTLPTEPTPPEPHRRRSIPVISAVIGAGVGVALAVVFGSVLYLAFAALGPLSMIGTAMSDRISGRRSFRVEMAAYRTEHASYLAAVEHLCQVDRNAAWARWPGPTALLVRSQLATSRLWERRRGAPGFLECAVGSGARPMVTTGSADGPLVCDVPLTVTLAGTWSFVGEQARSVARWLLLQAICSHAPRELAVTVLTGTGSPSPDLTDCLLLPHSVGADSATDSHRTRLVVVDGPRALASVEARAFGSAAAGACRPGGYVTVAVTADGRLDMPAGAPAAVDSAEPRVIVFVLVDSDNDLPTDWRPTPMPTRHGEGVDGRHNHPHSAHATGVSGAMLQRACRALAPLRDRAQGTGSIDQIGPIGLSEVLGPVDVLTMASRWAVPRPTMSLGISEHGPFVVDLERDGPHLLIAGTTGSGKSELLRTLIASGAAVAPPDALTFLLVDYKGGAAFDAVSDLPHVVGMVTDLDPALSTRALASLRAELHRRERMQVAGQNPGARLVIVIDEFATLASELPDFLAGLLDIAQRGRSLGLHLVLATQRPAGVVSPAMRANISTRICLRVTDPSESVDVIGIPDATHIPARAPGRGIARTSRGTLAFQTALVSAHETPDLDVARIGSAPRSASTKTTLAAITEAAQALTRGRAAPLRPWLPPLEPRIDPSSVAAETLAVVDRPAEQQQDLLTLPDTSILVLGPPRSGRTSALRRIATIAAARGDELVVLDAAGALAGLQGWPSVSTYLTADDPHLMLRTIELLGDPHRTSTDGRRRCVLVDHLDLVTAALDRADPMTGSSSLAELGARGGRTTIMASGPPSLAHQRSSGGFPVVLELGGSGNVPGRGAHAGHTVQIVDAPEATVPPAPAGHPWPDPVIVRPLPARVSAADLPSPQADAVPIGIGGDAATPVTIDLAASSGAVVITGPRRSGVTTTLETIARGAAATGIPVLWLVASRKAQPQTPIGDGIEVLPVWQETTSARERLGCHDGPLVLIADHDGLGTEHPAAALLGTFLQVCGTGQIAVIGERADLLTRLPRGHLRAALSFGCGVLLDADPPIAALLDVTVPRRTRTLGSGRGWWVANRVATPIQVAT